MLNFNPIYLGKSKQFVFTEKYCANIIFAEGVGYE